MSGSETAAPQQPAPRSCKKQPGEVPVPGQSDPNPPGQAPRVLNYNAFSGQPKEFPWHLVDAQASAKDRRAIIIDKQDAEGNTKKISFCALAVTTGACPWGSQCKFSHPYEYEINNSLVGRLDVLISKMNIIIDEVHQLRLSRSQDHPSQGYYRPQQRGRTPYRPQQENFSQGAPEQPVSRQEGPRPQTRYSQPSSSRDASSTRSNISEGRGYKKRSTSKSRDTQVARKQSSDLLLRLMTFD